MITDAKNVQSEAEKLEKIMSPSDTHKKCQLKEFREVIGDRVLQICSEHFKNTDKFNLLLYQLGLGFAYKIMVLAF